MLHITDISKSFGSQVLFDEASLHIKPGMRVGLVGPNGAGKTTLLRLIVGEMSLDEGEITYRKGLRIGFLPRRSRRSRTMRSSTRCWPRTARCSPPNTASPSWATRSARPTRSVAAGGTPAADPEELLEEMGALQTAFEDVHGYELESRAQTILRGMGFRDSDFERPIAELSGGWRMRVALVAAAAGAARPAADGRAHQPPGPGEPHLAGGVPAQLDRGPGGHQPRPLLS